MEIEKTSVYDFLAEKKPKLTSFFAILIIVPSLLNAFSDIWVAWNDLPIGEKEKINNKLFKSHWRESPVHSKKIIVEVQKIAVPITVDIYRNGDIFIDYGQSTQWFPFKQMNIPLAKFSLINSAMADEVETKEKVESTPTIPINVVNEKIEDNNVIRLKTFGDGSIEKQVIHMNTGKITSYEALPAKSKEPEIENKNESIEVVKIPKDKEKEVKVFKINAKNSDLPEIIDEIKHLDDK